MFFTSREVFHGRLSQAFLSRCTIINCPNYDNENYLTIELNPVENYKKICKSIVGNDTLEEEIINFNKILEKDKKIEKIEFLRFIRFCKSTKNIYDKQKNIEFKSLLYNNDKINYKYIVGISALRSLIDRFDSKQRKDIIQNHFIDYLPQKLYDLLTSELEDVIEGIPFELQELNNKKYICSKYSGIVLAFSELESPNINSLENIKWTKSSVDIADAILTALVSKTILVLEGPPGRGKTAISKAIFNYLNIENENLKRINFSLQLQLKMYFQELYQKLMEKKFLLKEKNKDYFQF